MRIDVDIDTEAIIKSHVLAVENLAVEADGETRAVTTGADLLTLESAFCTQLVELVSAEIMSFDISEEMLKN